MSAAPASGNDGPLALICGGGSLPLAVADSVTARGRDVLLFPLHGAANPADFEQRPHHWLYLGQSGKFLRLVRAAGCRDVVFIGSLVRPSLWQIRLDLATLRFCRAFWRPFVAATITSCRVLRACSSNMASVCSAPTRSRPKS